MDQAFDKTMALELIDRVRTRWWTMVAGACIGLSVALTALHFLPKVYEARTKILVTPQRIPQEYVRTTVIDDLELRMAAFKQAVLSRPYMMKIIDESFAPAPKDDRELERLLGSIRSRVNVQYLRGVFDISFRDKDPVRAAQVANALADYYIGENTKYRTTMAGETTDTLKEMANRVKGELEEQEKRIAQFKAAHLYETADQRSANLQLLTARQKDLDAKEAQLALARERMRSMTDWDIQAGWAPPGEVASGGGAESPRVAVLRKEIDTLRGKYSEDHPEVKAKKRQLDEALASSLPAPGTASVGEAKKPVARVGDPIAEQRQALQAELNVMEAETEKIRKEIAVYKARVEATPLVEQQLAELTKGLDVKQDQYKSYQSKVENARGAQQIEETRKGEQFEPIERAIAPALPVFPNVPIVLGAGLILGLLVFVGPVLAGEIFTPHVNSEAGLRNLTEIPVLVTIPRLESPEMLRLTRREWLRNWGFSAASVVLLILVIVLF